MIDFLITPNESGDGACVIDSSDNQVIAQFYDVWEMSGSGEGIFLTFGHVVAREYIDWRKSHTPSAPDNQ